MDVKIIKTADKRNQDLKIKVNKKRVAAYCRVSTDSEEQLNSYKSQVVYYRELISKKKEWSFAGIYADEAITGTSVKKRSDFQNMIRDCLDGKIDMVITKSISRFARNTMDVLQYVRLLKDHGISVYFEDENIETLSMAGELLLTVLSSVAQQEVENISANVKKGLSMKMERGEIVGFASCLGYDYDKESRKLSINEEEAEIVRYIFKRFLEGAGCRVIGRELGEKGYKSPKGGDVWWESTISDILENEKYCGDLLQGKTITVDPINKRRLRNFGEENQYYVKDHHEAIISRDDWNMVQQIREAKRASHPNAYENTGVRKVRTYNAYPFSRMIVCGYCGHYYTRRTWNAGSASETIAWVCTPTIRVNKKACPQSKGIPENVIQNAFLEAYRQMVDNETELVNSFLDKLKTAAADNGALEEIRAVEKALTAVNKDMAALVDLNIEGIIDKEIYRSKQAVLDKKKQDLLKKRELLENDARRNESIKDTVEKLRRRLDKDKVLEKFDGDVFLSIVDRVEIGGYDEKGNSNPYLITFIFKNGQQAAAAVNCGKKKGRPRLHYDSGKEIMKQFNAVKKNFPAIG